MMRPIGPLLLIRELPFSSQRLEGAAFLSKLCTCVATGLWASSVLLLPEAFGRAYYAETLLRVAPAAAWGWGYLSVAMLALFRLAIRARSSLWGIALYLSMCVGWCFVATYIVIMPTKLVGAIGGAPVVAGLSLLALLTSPYRRGP